MLGADRRPYANVLWRYPEIRVWLETENALLEALELPIQQTVPVVNPQTGGTGPAAPAAAPVQALPAGPPPMLPPISVKVKIPTKTDTYSYEPALVRSKKSIPVLLATHIFVRKSKKIPILNINGKFVGPCDSTDKFHVFDIRKCQSRTSDALTTLSQYGVTAAQVFPRIMRDGIYIYGYGVYYMAHSIAWAYTKKRIKGAVYTT